jgi:hypothetical protein
MGELASFRLLFLTGLGSPESGGHGGRFLADSCYIRLHLVTYSNFNDRGRARLTPRSTRCKNSTLAMGIRLMDRLRAFVFSVGGWYADM